MKHCRYISPTVARNAQRSAAVVETALYTLQLAADAHVCSVTLGVLYLRYLRVSVSLASQSVFFAVRSVCIVTTSQLTPF